MPATTEQQVQTFQDMLQGERSEEEHAALSAALVNSLFVDFANESLEVHRHLVEGVRNFTAEVANGTITEEGFARWIQFFGQTIELIDEKNVEYAKLMGHFHPDGTDGDDDSGAGDGVGTGVGDG